MGTRLRYFHKRRRYWDHPHACGDKVYDDSLSYYETGSSPRVWGQDCRCSLIKHNIRIIPTRVGTSTTIVGISAIVLGSSPRVWGQASSKLRKKRGKRIIPTRVGTRPLFYQFVIQFEDHPHACGDKTKLT